MRSNEKPKKPYRNIWQFRDELLALSGRRIQDTNFWPCLMCYGRGKIRDPEDRDPIEGYKLAPWHKCTTCNGSGQSDRATIENAYKLRLDNWRDAVARWKRNQALIKSAMSKLTTDELKALRHESH